MNVVDRLLKADVKKAEELETGSFSSKRLAKILGEKEAVPVEIKEVPSRRLNDIVSYQLKGNGSFDYSKNFDAKIMMCVEGIVSPNLRDAALQKHFECKSASELCEKLFGNEITDISDAISELSGISDNEEEEVKN